MKKEDFKVGNKVYLKIIAGSNRAWRLKNKETTIDDWIVEAEVVSVGRKYITVKLDDRGFHTEKFDITNGFRHYYNIGGADYNLLLSKEGVYEEEERKSLYSNIKDMYFNSFGNGKEKISLDKLKRIKAILEEGESE